MIRESSVMAVETSPVRWTYRVVRVSCNHPAVFPRASISSKAMTRPNRAPGTSAFIIPRRVNSRTKPILIACEHSRVGPEVNGMGLTERGKATPRIRAEAVARVDSRPGKPQAPNPKLQRSDDRCRAASGAWSLRGAEAVGRETGSGRNESNNVARAGPVRSVSERPSGNMAVPATGAAMGRAIRQATLRVIHRAIGRATVRATGRATRRATQTATARATGRATGRAAERVTETATRPVTGKATGTATGRATQTTTVRTA
jgi:hypothetical protein